MEVKGASSERGWCKRTLTTKWDVCILSPIEFMAKAMLVTTLTRSCSVDVDDVVWGVETAL